MVISRQYRAKIRALLSIITLLCFAAARNAHGQTIVTVGDTLLLPIYSHPPTLDGCFYSGSIGDSISGMPLSAWSLTANRLGVRFTPSAVGSATCSVRVRHSYIKNHAGPPSGCQDQFEIVYIEAAAIAKVASVANANKAQFHIWPNPSRGKVFLQWSQSRPGHVSMRLYDPVGHVVATPVNQDFGFGDHIREFDWITLPSGIYVLATSIGDFATVTRLINLRE